MSIRIDNSGDDLKRTTGLPTTLQDPWTMCVWWRMTSDRSGVWRCILSFEASGSGSPFCMFGWSSGNACVVYANGAGGTLGDAPQVGEWVFCFMRRNESDTDSFDAGFIEYNDLGTFTKATDANTGAGSMTSPWVVLGNSYFNEYTNGDFAYFKMWNAILTDTELYQERWSVFPRRYANLNCYAPLWTISHLEDLSGNGYNFTTAGTLTNNDNPPVGFGMAESGLYYPTGLTTQYLRPISDVRDGSWTPSTGVDNYAVIDEAIRDDDDYTQLAL